MNRPLLSVVLPTRERAEVLAEALAALLTLRNPNIEFIVCDNASTDGTGALVESFADPRLRYIRSETRLSMPQNFEFGLRAATGEYVMTLGDDDFIIEENLELALEQALNQELELLYWHRAYFYWGSYPIPELASTFAIPKGRGHYAVDPPTLLQMTYRGLVNYQYLPSIYNSLCRRSFLKRYQDYLRGHYFTDYVISLDVFSSLVFCSLCPNVEFQESPASVSGISHRSNGMSLYTSKEEAGKFAKELGFSDSNAIMPDEYKGVVLPTTDHGIAQISVLTDYVNVASRLLIYDRPVIPWLTILSKVYLHRLLAGGHIHLSDDSELYRLVAPMVGREPLVEEDLQTYFFRLWSIPLPDCYAARFESRDASVRHITAHLAQIGFNAAAA